MVWRLEALSGHEGAGDRAGLAAVALAVALRLPIARRWALALGPVLAALVVANTLRTLHYALLRHKASGKETKQCMLT